MSGASLDAVKAVLVDLNSAPPTLIARCLEPLPDTLQQKITALSCAGIDELRRASELDVAFGRLFGEVAKHLLEAAMVPPSHVLGIGLHGLAVRHQPSGAHPFTVQLGDPNIVAESTGVTTVADFRRRDMAAGGQGAPLGAAFHAAVFHSTEHDRVVLNVGEIASITLLPSNSARPVGGFDTGPGNALMDAWAQKTPEHSAG